MRNRVLLTVGATALALSSCAQPEPQLLFEEPRSASATDLSASSTSVARDQQPGRFIARCATEADGGTPGMTFFTDGSQNVTDHCLSRYFIGVQPAPGALYVPDRDAGSYAPGTTSPSQTGTSARWTPSQPRTDGGPSATDAPSDTENSTTGNTTPGTSTPGTSTLGTSTPGGPTSTSGPTQPTTPPGTSNPDITSQTVSPTVPGQTSPPGTNGPDSGSSDRTPPTEVPTRSAVPTAPLTATTEPTSTPGSQDLNWWSGSGSLTPGLVPPVGS